MSDRADAVVERNALFAVGLVGAPLARRRAQFDIGQRQVMAIESSATLATAASASSSVQPLSMVLARKA
jgi:hypothetical protein